MKTEYEYQNVPMNTSQEDITAKVNRVKKTFRSHKTLPLEYRLDQLRNLFYGIKDYDAIFKEAIYKDFGKCAGETTFTELVGSLEEVDQCINNLHKWAKDETVGFPALKFIASSPAVAKTPLGCVLMITPWNYPFFLSLAGLAAAIAAGNTVIWKPTELIPNTSKAMTKMIEERLDPDLIQVVNGGIPETTFLLTNKFDKIMVTGSGRVGKVVSEAAAKHLTPVLLELGGKSPVFLSKTTDLKVAARRIMWGKLTNAGQTCVAPDYVLIERGIEDEFVGHCKDAINKMYPNLSKETVDYSHIPNERLFQRLVDTLGRTKGKVVYGGGSDAESLFIEPAIIKDVKADDSLMEDELFGPYLPLITVDNLEQEGVDFVIEHHDTPLALYVFSKDKKQTNEILSKTRSGSAVVNDVLIQVACGDLPFGGIGQSGMGAYHGKYGFDAFSHHRAIMRQPLWAEGLLSMRYPPFKEANMKRFARMSTVNNWYGRTGPVKRSIFARIFGSKVFWLGLFAAIAYKIKGRS